METLDDHRMNGNNNCVLNYGNWREEVYDRNENKFSQLFVERISESIKLPTRSFLEMPQGHRKLPFSGKKKKEQLAAKKHGKQGKS